MGLKRNINNLISVIDYNKLIQQQSKQNSKNVNYINNNNTKTLTLFKKKNRNLKIEPNR